MNTKVVIRVPETWARQEFGATLGTPFRAIPRSGDPKLDEDFDRLVPPFYRQIVLDARDPLLKDVKKRISKYESTGIQLGRIVLLDREYTENELREAELLHLVFTAVFEPSGLEMGTAYDESLACPKCGQGRVQRSGLKLNLSKIPKKADIAKTIAGDEWIVSERMAKLMQAEKLTGYDLEIVEHRGKRAPAQIWYRLQVTGNAGPTVCPTRFGDDFLTDEPNEQFICREHSLSGLNIVSEVFVSRRNLAPVDLLVTSNRVGIRSGVVMPFPLLLISPRFYGLLRSAGVKGAKFEKAHVVAD